jgi:hypothetical protein
VKTRDLDFDPKYHKHETGGLTIKPTHSVTELSMKEEKNGRITSQLLHSAFS